MQICDLQTDSGLDKTNQHLDLVIRDPVQLGLEFCQPHLAISQEVLIDQNHLLIDAPQQVREKDRREVEKEVEDLVLKTIQDQGEEMSLQGVVIGMIQDGTGTIHIQDAGREALVVQKEMNPRVILIDRNHREKETKIIRDAVIEMILVRDQATAVETPDDQGMIVEMTVTSPEVMNAEVKVGVLGATPVIVQEEMIGIQKMTVDVLIVQKKLFPLAEIHLVLENRKTQNLQCLVPNQ